MAVTVTLYNHTTRLLGSLDLDNLRCMLLDDTASFVASHTTLTDVAGAMHAKEVSGNGWTTGGEFLANVEWKTVTTNDAILDCDDISVVATGGIIGPAYAAVYYDDTHPDDAPLVYIDFGEAVDAGEATPFFITISPNGIIRTDYTLP